MPGSGHAPGGGRRPPYRLLTIPSIVAFRERGIQQHHKLIGVYHAMWKRGGVPGTTVLLGLPGVGGISDQGIAAW